MKIVGAYRTSVIICSHQNCNFLPGPTLLERTRHRDCSHEAALLAALSAWNCFDCEGTWSLVTKTFGVGIGLWLYSSILQRSSTHYSNCAQIYETAIRRSRSFSSICLFPESKFRGNFLSPRCSTGTLELSHVHSLRPHFFGHRLAAAYHLCPNDACAYKAIPERAR